ncbi:hypothetical protein E3U43_013712 [Larimichthys crocea]|uniref:Uncharacterized protein n=1 Tax=Larimichthys crocea TaxID=215358 RepID=A0ACD3RB85_LARCR|nr:hypothetical protein E3U43_013712 [Larimichthys crocea]
MAKHNISLIIAILLALLVFIVTMVFSALAAPGIYPFLASTGNTSEEFVTQITPSGWTFSIWTIIYIFLALVLAFVLSGTCRKNAYGYVYCSPAILPHGFFVTWCLNLGLNTGWLFLWDRRFILENSVLDKHVRYILTIYPAVIWALTGVFTKNYDAAAPTRNNIFIAAQLAVACTLFVSRVVLVIWKHVKKPFFKDVSPDDMSPMETAANQKKIFNRLQWENIILDVLLLIVVSVVGYLISLVFNGLSVVGIGPYDTTTGNVSAVFDTQITPSGWTFNIWSVIYVWLTAMIIYILTGLCRKNGYGYVYCSPAVLPYGFFISWCLNLCFNIGWLLVWDRGMMIPALVFLFLVICTNYSMVCFTCHGLHILWSLAQEIPQSRPVAPPCAGSEWCDDIHNMDNLSQH